MVSGNRTKKVNDIPIEDFEWFDDEEEDGVVEVRSNTVILELNANLVRNCQIFNRCEDGTLPDAASMVEMAMEMACQMAEDAGMEFVEDDDVALMEAEKATSKIDFSKPYVYVYSPKTSSSDSTKGHEYTFDDGDPWCDPFG